MILPNFLVIGRAKSGTTALHATLAQHPQVFMSQVKEPCFFVCEGGSPSYDGPVPLQGIEKMTDYRKLFERAGNAVARGEASPQYSDVPLAERASAAIQRHIPHARLLAVIRQPADFAWSMYQFRRMMGEETAPSFRAALQEEAGGYRETWNPTLCYRANSHSYPQLATYFRRFTPSQIRVFLYEDWRQRPDWMIAEICRFLGVEVVSLPSLERGKTLGVHSALLQYTLRHPNRLRSVLRLAAPRTTRVWLKRRLLSLNRTRKPLMNSEEKHDFIVALRDDILRTQDLIDRDLSHWLC